MPTPPARALAADRCEASTASSQWSGRQCCTRAAWPKCENANPPAVEGRASSRCRIQFIIWKNLCTCVTEITSPSAFHMCDTRHGTRTEASVVPSWSCLMCLGSLNMTHRSTAPVTWHSRDVHLDPSGDLGATNRALLPFKEPSAVRTRTEVRTWQREMILGAFEANRARRPPTHGRLVHVAPTDIERRMRERHELSRLRSWSGRWQR